jgi:DNA-binding CsgD family transcriptional regulator
VDSNLKLHEHEPEVLARLVPELVDRFQTAKVLAFGIRSSEQGGSLSFVHASGPGFTRALGQDFNRLVAEHQPGFLFDPARPQRSQRNVALVLPPILNVPRTGLVLRKENNRRTIRLLPGAGLWRRRDRSLWSNLYRNAGIHNDFVLRALICDGPVLLAWLGMFQPQPPTQHQEHLLSSLLPSLEKRLKVERVLGNSGYHWETLETVMEKIGRTAFLLTGSGSVMHANSAGQRLMDADSVGLHEQLQLSLRAGLESGFELTRLECTGVPDHFLAVQRRALAADTSRLAASVGRWQLTAREAAVLAKLARGDSNRRIGATLGCSESTVERQVTSLFRKAGVEGRAALITMFWSPARSVSGSKREW